MPVIRTLGRSCTRREFAYAGSVNLGVIIKGDGVACVMPAELFYAVIRVFRGKTVRGGFSRTKQEGTLGSWVRQHSQEYGPALNSRHASFMAAILVHEMRVSSRVVRNAVYLFFPA